MRSYVAYKNQIRGVEDVSETVKTVEKIAASSVHFLKQEVANLNTYTDEIERTLNRLSLFYQKKDNPLLNGDNNGERTLVIITGDKGLVGGLWHEIINASLEYIDKYKNILFIGTKGKSYLMEENLSETRRLISLGINYDGHKDIAGGESHGQQIPITDSRLPDVSPKENIESVSKYILDEFKKGIFSQVDILYPQFISLAEQTPHINSFLPFDFELKEGKEDSIGLPIFESSKREVFDALLQKYIGVFFHKIIMEARLSELSARTVAMEHAAVKTKELIQKLTISYTKERRKVMTKRQLESFTAHKVI